MAAKNTSKGVKRKRGPYLSYLANPLQHEVPRSTLRFWSRELCEGNIEENRDESCSLEFTTSSQNMYMVSSGDADSNNTDAESIEEGRENETLVVDEEGTKILDEQADCINSPEESDNSAENAEAKGKYETTAENITTIDEPVYGMYLPEDAIFIIGAIVKHTIKIQHRQLLEREIGEVGEIFKFKRVCIDGMIFHCKEYKPGIRRNNFTVQYQSPSCPQLNYGQVLYFIKCYMKCPNPVFCSELCSCKVASYHAIVECLARDNNTVLSSDTITGASAPHIVPVLSSVNETVVIPLEMIVKICLQIDFGIDGKHFVVTFPNMFEKD